MKRSVNRRRIGPMAWLFGVGCVAASLMLFFTFGDPVRLIGDRYLRPEAAELEHIALWADLRSNADTIASPAIYYLQGAGEGVACVTEKQGPGWVRQWFEAEGYGDTVKVRRLRTQEGGFVIQFDRAAPFQAKHHIVLLPADRESLRAKYLEVIAGTLGLLTPEIQFARVIACGHDLGIFQVQERIDADFLEHNRIGDGALFTQGFDPDRPDHLYPAFDKDTLANGALNTMLEAAYRRAEQGDATALRELVDTKAMAARLLMHEIENGNTVPSEEWLFVYRWSTGRVVPVYRNGRVSQVAPRPGPWSMNCITPLLQDPDVQAQYLAHGEHLRTEQQRIEEQFAALDKTWLPMLVSGGALSFEHAHAARVKNALLNSVMGADIANVPNIVAVRATAGRATFTHGMPLPAWALEQDRDLSSLDLLAKHYKVQVAGDSVVFPRGKYFVDEDLVLPEGYRVVFLQGARITINAGRSIVVRGPLQVRGTRRNPVFVRAAQDEVPFGTFAMVGDGRYTCSLQGLQISGGSEARINGVYHSGMLSIHGATTTGIADCIIGGSMGEDGLNIKEGVVLISNTVFEDGHADLVDLDLCTGTVRGCIFRSGRKNGNGDGLDVSGAHVLVEDCRFLNMLDKGISVGENSQLLVRRSHFQGNTIALAAKDLSTAHVMDNVFVDNALVFGAYRKKDIYGGARIITYANTYTGNKRQEEVDELSKVDQAVRPDASVMEQFDAD